MIDTGGKGNLISLKITSLEIYILPSAARLFIAFVGKRVTQKYTLETLVAACVDYRACEEENRYSQRL